MSFKSFFVATDRTEGETRIAIVPSAAKRLTGLGATITVESGAGQRLGYSDASYTDVGAHIAGSWREGLKQSDVILSLNPPPQELLEGIVGDKVLIGYLYPFRRPEVIQQLCAAGGSALCMELIPRTTLAQKMDALSSQASLAGYVSVILAAERFGRIFPMMMTPAGTIPPAKVLVIGAGVAGLQAIATAKRLGARVEAYDTRPQVATEIKSLGAKFIDLGVSGEQTEQGYAKALTEQQIEAQRRALAKHCAAADIVITTAAVFGRKAPVIITEDMVAGMAPGSVIVDGAAETGGNVACATPGEETEIGGVRVVALENLAGRVPGTASDMYANNLVNLVSHFWNADTNEMDLESDDEILKGCLAVRRGEVVNDRLRELLARASGGGG